MGPRPRTVGRMPHFNRIYLLPLLEPLAALTARPSFLHLFNPTRFLPNRTRSLPAQHPGNHSDAYEYQVALHLIHQESRLAKERKICYVVMTATDLAHLHVACSWRLEE